MSRFGGIGKQYFDNNGKVLSGGLLYFYETGTTTDKATYSDSAETVANTQPVVLDASGRQPNVYYSGVARVVLQESDGTQVEERDPIGSAATSTAFQEWDASVTYSQNDLVEGSNNLFYKSFVNNNGNNDPTITNSLAWQQIRFLNVYSASVSYEINEVIQSGDRRLWISLESNNLNNTPQSSPTKWRPLSNELWTNVSVQSADFDAEVGSRYLIDTATNSGITMNLPFSPSEGDIVGFVDWSRSFHTDNLTISRSLQNIMGEPDDLIADEQYFSGALQFTATQGWVLV